MLLLFPLEIVLLLFIAIFGWNALGDKFGDGKGVYENIPPLLVFVPGKNNPERAPGLTG